MREQSLEFRPPLWLAGVLVIGLVASVAFALILADLEGSKYESIASWSLAVLCSVGIIDVMTTKVVLGTNELQIISNFRKKVVPRTDLVRVVSEKGAPIALEKSGGGWIKLPETVSSLHPNTLRAWLKRGSIGR